MKTFPSVKSFVLVVLQFSFIVLLLLNTSTSSFSTWAIALTVLAVGIVIWAIVTMMKSRLTIFPEPVANAKLITDGPYRLIIHPMYTAVLLGCMALVIQEFTYSRLLIQVALTIVLAIKLRWEEQMLCQKFNGYKAYMKETKRIIPFVI